VTEGGDKNTRTDTKHKTQQNAKGAEPDGKIEATLRQQISERSEGLGDTREKEAVIYYQGEYLPGAKPEGKGKKPSFSYPQKSALNG